MATNVESTVPAEAVSNVINLLALLRTRVDKEFNSIQTYLNERRTVLLAQINALEQKYTQSQKASEDNNLLENTKKELLKVADRFVSENYRSTLAQLEIDSRNMSVQIVEFSNIALQIDSRELMESFDKLGHLSYECKVNYEKRKIPFKTTQTNIQGAYFVDFDMACDDNDNIYITSSATNKINVYTADGVCVRTLPAELPLAVCIRNNTLYISELKSHTICKMNIDGSSSVKSIGAEGTELGQFKGPIGLTTNKDCLFVCDQNNHRLQVFTHELQPVRIIQTEHMKYPTDININNDALYVLNYNKSILVISVEGQLLKHLASIQDYVTGACYFCIDTASNILISDCNGSRIQVFSISGQHLHTLGEEMNASTKQPYCYNTHGICVLSTGVVVTASNINDQCCIQHF